MKKLLSVLLILGVLFTVPALAFAEEEAQPGPVGVVKYDNK
jgi:hypothetical protein